MKIGTPSRERNCLGVPPPMRTPVPAAGMMARTFINVWNLGSAGSLESRILDRGSERTRTPLVPALAAVALCLLVNDLRGAALLRPFRGQLSLRCFPGRGYRKCRSFLRYHFLAVV